MHRNIAELIKRHAVGTPHKCAVTDGTVEITYGALERASRRFAARLITMGCQRGDRVVLFARKQAVLTVEVLGVFKSGAIHVPLDPALPPKRLEHLLEDLSPRVVVTDPEHLPTLRRHGPPGIPTVMVDELYELLREDGGELPDDSVLPEVRAEDVAYCICTSGSTGLPKGVLIQHGSVVDFFEGTREFYDVGPDSRCISLSPLHFDGSVIDALFPLYQGAWLYMYSDFVAPDLLFEVIADQAVTHVAAFGAMLDVIAEAPDFDDVELPNLETVLTGAHAPNVRAVQRWLRKTSGGKVINGYGPTEATCAVAAHVIWEIEPERTEPYPIGRPLKHAELYLVGESGEILREPGLTGELWISGSQLMKGYWRREEESRLRLVQLNGSRCYRTGDICTYLPDGNLLFLGRNDTEVNIGGYRVNLNEIKRVVDNIQGVRGSEVVRIDSKYGEPILIAAVVLGNETRPCADRELRLIEERITEELPSYMVPRHWVVMDSFPQLASGKIDRKTLASMLEKQHN